MAKPPAPSNTNVPPPRNLTPPLCEKLRRDMMQACLKVAETHGLTVEGWERSNVDLRHGFNISFRVGIPMADGAIYSPDKAMFEVLAPHFGLKPSGYGRTFRTNGDLHRIVGINPNRPNTLSALNGSPTVEASRCQPRTSLCICSVQTHEMCGLCSLKCSNMQLRANRAS